LLFRWRQPRGAGAVRKVLVKEKKLKITFGLMLLAVLMVWGCETTNSGDTVSRAATCAMCGASVSGDYFLYSADRSMGPTNR